MAACLYLGACATLSFRAAAALRGSPVSTRPRIEVTVPRNRNPSRSRRILVHRPQDPILEQDITTIDGIPVTKPARTLLDLATVEPEEVVERCLDDALRRRLVSLPFFESWLEDPRRSRHRGARMLQRLVAARATVGVTESPLEAAVLKLIRDAGLPTPMLQYEVRDGDRFVGRVDFAYPEERVAIEADGFRYHDGRRGFDDERARGNELEAMGWRVLRVTAKHLEEYPDAVVAWISRALARER
jgi:very-short-patch-repair endonuclease